MLRDAADIFKRISGSDGVSRVGSSAEKEVDTYGNLVNGHTFSFWMQEFID
jgi:hypothetical protein